MNFKNVFTTSVILMNYCLLGAENVEVTFSQADVASRLRKIDDSFLASSDEEDNWLLFVPLLEWVNRQRTPEKARASEQEKSYLKFLIALFCIHSPVNMTIKR